MPNPADPTPRAPAVAQSRWRRALDQLARAATGAWYPTMVFLITRVGLGLLGYLTLGKFAVAPSIRPFPRNLLLDGLFRWDSDWYAHIADQGYIAPAAIIAGQQRNTAFFPLYPLCVRLTKLVVGNTWIAGLLVANLAFLAAAIILHRLVRDRLGDATARRAVVLLCVSPFSVFFMAMYSESLFLALALAAFYAADKRHWFWASVLVGLAGATRVTGCLLLLGLVILYLEQSQLRWRNIRADILLLLLGTSGPLAFCGFLWARYGNPFEFYRAQYVSGWAKEAPITAAFAEIVAAIKPAALAAGSATSLTFVQIGSIGFVIGAVVWGMLRKKLPLSHGIWALLMTASVLAKWTSAGRYLSVVFPVYVAAAALGEREALYYLIVALSCVLAAHQQILFVLGRWVA
jgi:Predicted integral membrane protein